MWNDLRQDARYAFRALRRSPAFSATAILTLALGIGANTAIFSVLSGSLMRRYPYSEPSRLVFLWSTSGTFPREPLTPGRLVDFREQLTSIAAVAGISHIPLNLTGSGEPERLSGSSVSSSFFDVLGVRAMLGDTFHTGAADDRAVVLSHRFWAARFGSDPAIVGRQIVLNGTARTVLGVMPPEFDWPAVTTTPGSAPGPLVWVPGTSRDIPRTPVETPGDLAANRRMGYLRAVARLKDGFTVEQARRESELLAERLARTYPDEDGGRGATVVPLREQFVGHVRAPILVLLAAVGFVLAIACANIASLLLGRTAIRRRELAVRLAIGASRGRLVRQLLTESTLLALAGAGLGLFVAWAGQRWLGAIVGSAIAGAEHATVDARVLLFTLGVALVTGVLCGLAPAHQSSSTHLTMDLAEGDTRTSSGSRGGRMRDALVVAEIAVALVLLAGAGLMLQSFRALSRVDVGIDTRNLLTFDVFLGGGRARSPEQQVQFYDDALAVIAALPGVTSTGAAVTLPIGGDDFAASFNAEGRPVPAPGQEPRAGYQVVTPGYFRTMGIPVVAGRDFHSSDTRDAAPVAIVNQTLARREWPGEEPVGKRIRMGNTPNWITIVGVTADIRHFGPAEPPRPELYLPHAQRPFSFMAVVVRTAGAPEGLVGPIRSAIARLDPAQPISGVNTMAAHVESVLARPRTLATLAASFGAVALVLALVGIYGVMAYAVAQRTREIAIRSALGASAREVVLLVLARAAALAGVGVAAGLAATAGLARFLTGMLFEVAPIDPPTYAAVTLTLALVALLAAAVPAIRAARIGPAEVLRS
jgi:putative ABC transport system permease protein